MEIRNKKSRKQHVKGMENRIVYTVEKNIPLPPRHSFATIDKDKIPKRKKK